MAIPYMPLYIADYQADTGHLTTLEHGAYLLLIMCYWQRREKLPNDDRKLARIAGVGPREWAKMRDTISEFFVVDCNNWFHPRIQAELDKLQAKSLKKRKGGLARAQQMLSTRSARAQLNKGIGNIPLDKSNGLDLSKTLFDTGVAALTSQGLAESSARSFLASCQKVHGDAAALDALNRSLGKTNIRSHMKAILSKAQAQREYFGV